MTRHIHEDRFAKIRFWGGCVFWVCVLLFIVGLVSLIWCLN